MDSTLPYPPYSPEIHERVNRNNICFNNLIIGIVENMCGLPVEREKRY
jgi:hypothetical protein